MRRFQQFARSPALVSESLKLFTLIALNCALRNGDAHLKNFGVIYDSVQGEAHLAPVYDVVTTTVYLPKDQMALNLNGTNKWPTAKDLVRFAEGKSLATRQDLLKVFERIQNALSEVARSMDTYCHDHPEFREIERHMAEEWGKGRQSITF
jgi:serine/threonine-protein kinase HipA